MTMKTAFVSIISVLALTSMAPADAAETEVTFNYYQSELASNAGAERVATRMKHFVTRTCTENGRRPLSALRIQQSCKVELMTNLMDNIDDPRLARALEGRVIIASN